MMFKSPPKSDKRKQSMFRNKKSILKTDGFYQKEDIENQLNLTKIELNQHIDENIKLKTKNQVQKEQIKEKKKLIDELLQNMYTLSVKIENLGLNDTSFISNNVKTDQTQKFMEKSPFNLF